MRFQAINYIKKSDERKLTHFTLANILINHRYISLYILISQNNDGIKAFIMNEKAVKQEYFEVLKMTHSLLIYAVLLAPIFSFLVFLVPLLVVKFKFYGFNSTDTELFFHYKKILDFLYFALSGNLIGFYILHEGHVAGFFMMFMATLITGIRAITLKHRYPEIY